MNNNIQKYPAYKPSGTEWLGEIPEHWEAVALGSILELKSDKNHPDYEVLSVYREYGVIQKDSRDDNHNTTSLDKTNYKAVNPGDLVVNKMKAWQGSMGISSYKGIVSPAYITCNVTSKKIVADFLHQLLRSQSYIGEYNRISYGVRVGQWDIHYEDFKRVTVLLPPEEEQLAISSFLDRKTTQIDQAITQKERTIELLKERRQIIIHNAVTKGLNPNVKMKYSGVKWIGEIPEHWEVSRLKNHIEMITGYPFKSERYTNEGIKLARGINVKEGVFNWDETRFWPIIEKYLEPFLLSTGDVLIGMDGSKVGKNFCIVKETDLPILLLQRVARLRTKVSLHCDFLFNHISNRNFLLWVEMTKTDPMVPHIAPSDIKNFIITIPPRKEQQAISDYINNASQKISTAIFCKEKEIEKLKEYKATLINSAVTGKIKVC